MILSPRDAVLFSVASLNPEVIDLTVPFQPALLESFRGPGGHPLRSHQLDLLLEALGLMRQGYRRVLIQLATGGGKTVMAAAVIRAAVALARRAQFIVHRRELIKQTSKSFDVSHLAHGFVASGYRFDPAAEVLLAGVQTLVNRLAALLPPHLIILDEAHHCTAATWDTVLAAYPDAWIIGLTATPERLDGRGLNEHFDVMVTGPTEAWLIEQGFLSPFDYYAPHRPDLSEVGDVGGDYNRAGAAAVMDRPKLVGDMVEHYQRLAPGERGIVFAVNRQHSRNIAQAFTDAGVRAAHIDSTMTGERDRIMEAFEAGEIEMLTNVDLFDEGLDVPGISYVGGGRPSKSLAKVRQQNGRGLRIHPGKTRCVLADHAGNCFTHGLPDDVVEWSLLGRKGRPRGPGNDDAEPVRQCLICYRVARSSAKVCPGCGTEFQRTAREIEVEAGRLEKLVSLEARKAEIARQKAEVKGARSIEAMTLLGQQRGYPDPRKWAYAQISSRKEAAARYRRS